MPAFNSQKRSERVQRAPEEGEDVTGMRVLRWYDFPPYTVLLMLRIGVLVYSCWQIGSDLRGTSALPLAILCVPLFAPSVFDQLVWLSLFWYRVPINKAAARGLRVAVVTTYVGKSESVEMLEGTLRHMVMMQYVHDTWVLDEDDDPEVRRICARLGVHHFSRRTTRSLQTDSGPFKAGTKYGNYNAWLFTIGFTKYDIVSAFDCDHAPESGFLEAVLGFFEDNCIGYVQAAQCYSNQSASFVARGAAEESYAYYSIVQGSASQFGYPVITGCHNTHRVAALKDVSGFAPHDADDLLLTLNYKAAGWRGVYIPVRLARGLAPVSWQAYLGQQRRWARSVFDLKLRPPATGKQIGFAPRAISLLQGIRYLLDGSFILSFFFLIALSLTGVSPALVLLGGVTTLYLVTLTTNLYLQRFYVEPATEAGFPWRAYVLRFAKWPYAFMALLDVLKNRHYAYTVTPKTETSASGNVTMYAQFALAACMAAAWAVGSITGQIANESLHLLGACAVAVPAVIGVTGRMRFGPEFNKAASTTGFHPYLSGTELLTGSVVALLSFLWSLRGFQGTVVWQDSSRHLMNGLFLYDCFRTGNLFHIREFGRWYFAHYPALSMPYHPPLMPLLEAMVFAVLGPSFGAARLLLAATVGICFYLLYRLVLISSRSVWVSLSACALFLFVPGFQDLQQDVMLEFPALLCVLLALTYLTRIGFIRSIRQGIVYGAFCAAGILTKQTVFLILVPFLCCVVARKGRLLLRPGLWVSALVGTGASGLLLLMARSVGWSGVPQNWAPMPPVRALQHNLLYYGQQVSRPVLFSAVGVLGALALAWPWIRRNAAVPNAKVYASWMLGASIVLLLAPAYDLRYQFFVLPPLCAWGCELLYRVLRNFFDLRATRAVMLAATAAFCIWNGRQQPLWRTGPEVAAARIASDPMKRILFFGPDNGAFIFSTRLHDPAMEAIIFRGDKVFSEGISSRILQQFTYEYGVEAIVLQCPAGTTRECTRFVQDRDSFRPIFAQESLFSRGDPKSTLEVFRVQNRSPHPKTGFQEKISAFGTVQAFHF